MVSPAQCPNCRNIYMKYLVVFGGNNNISKENKMVDAYGAVTWWGFSPALDINNRRKYYIRILKDFSNDLYVLKMVKMQ